MRRLLPLLLLLCGFGSGHGLTLDAVLKRTADSNPEITKARIELERASGQRLVFRSIGLPDAVIGIVGGDEGGHRAGQKPNQPFGFAYGGMTQAFFNLAVPASFRRGDLEVLIAQQRLNVAMMDQLHAARVAFYTAIYSHGLNQIRDDQRQRLEQNIASQQDRYQSGLATRGNLVGAEVQMRELDPQVEASQRAYDGALVKLAEAMGEDIGPSALLPEPVGELKYVAFNVDLQTEVTRTLERRPDLELARLVVRAANEDQRIMEAAYYPIVNATVSGDYIPVSDVRRTQGTGSPQRSNDIVSSEIRAGGTYTWRVIDNGRTYGAVMRQRSAREINELLLHKLEGDVSRDMSRIQRNLQAIASKHELLSKADNSAMENASTVQENLTGGLVSQLDFRLAQNAALEIRSGLLSLAYQENMARAEWDRATGRYFQFSVEPPQNVR
ncbi:MAG: hypothetical protein QOH39_1580 [Verrucomicrobiota bacterium]